jgi:pyruvate kinase
MNVARINCSHGSVEENEETIELVKRVREELKVPLAIMLDTKGPDVRIGKFEGGGVDLRDGQLFTFTTRPTVGMNDRVFVDYKELPKLVKKGQSILLNDGFIRMTVVHAEGHEIKCKVNMGGRLSDRKTFFAPGIDFALPFISRADEVDLVMGIKQKVDWVAASFVGSAADVLKMRTLMKKYGADIPIIAKIESAKGVRNLIEILSVVDGIMVARGDLGVEFALERLPAIQKMLIEKARRAGKIVVTATEMLESMITRARPTRAETTDVANSIYDGTSCVMLSGETAVGAHPILAVQYMKKIAEDAERNIKTRLSSEIHDEKDAFASTIVTAAANAGAKAICAFTKTGSTAVRVAKFAPSCPVFAFALEEEVYYKLGMINDIYPELKTKILTVQQMIDFSNGFVVSRGVARSGDVIVINASFSGATDLVLIHKVV